MADNPPVQRRLAAILAADVAGYSRLMGADEEGTLARLKALRAGLIDPAIAGHNGRIVKTTGDGLLVEFASVVDAMRCAIQWQGAMGERAETGIQFRIGVNLGDIIIDGDDIHGDGVNIAARLEAMADPGGICISHAVLTQTRGKLDFPGRRSGRPGAQEHRPADPCLPGTGGGDEAHARTRRPAAPRQAVDRGLAVPEHERRPGAGIFRRRHGRGDHHRALPHPLAVRHRPQFELHLQGPSRRRESRSGASWACAMCSKARCARAATGCASPGS